MKRSSHIVGHLFLGLAAIAGFGAAVLLLWNVLLPQIFGVATINFWQALGLLVLCRILFGSFGGFGGKHWMSHAHAHFHNNPIREKWMKMTPEERKEFIKKRHHFNYGFDFSFGHDFFNNEEPEKQD